MKSDTIVTTEYIVNRRGSQQPPQIHLLPVGVSDFQTADNSHEIRIQFEFIHSLLRFK